MIEIPNQDLSLNYARNEMPQIAFANYDEFIEFVGRHNVDCNRDVSIPAKWLIPTQNEINPTKVQALVDQPDFTDDRPVLVTNDHYIVDGHHRAIASYNIAPDKLVNCIQFDCKIATLIDLAKQFPKSFYKELHESTPPCHKTIRWIEDQLKKRTDTKNVYREGWERYRKA